MPPRLSRIPPTTSSSNSNTTAQPSSSGSHRSPVNDDRAAFIALDYNVPVLPPPAVSAPSNVSPTSRTRRRPHARSVSQPFPSLTNSSSPRKTEKKLTRKDFGLGFDFDDDDDDDDDDDEDYDHHHHHHHHHGHAAAGGGSDQTRTHGGDTLTGKCLTCNSTCRWPRNVQMYRCTVCLTVNDLEFHPAPGASLWHRDEEVDDDRPPPPPPKDDAPELLPAPVSIDETRRIIRSCLLRFLRSRLSAARRPRDEQPKQQQLDGNNGLGKVQTSEKQSRPWDLPPDFSNAKFLFPPPERSGHAERNDGRVRVRSSSDTPPPPSRTRELPSRGRENSPMRLGTEPRTHSRDRSESRPSIFRPLEEYIIRALHGCECLNNSFMTASALRSLSNAGEIETRRRPVPTPVENNVSSTTTAAAPPQADTAMLAEIDPKMLLLGDLGENSSWWMGGRPRRQDVKDASGSKRERERSPPRPKSIVTSKSPRIDWDAVAEWYYTVLHVGEKWRELWNELVLDEKKSIDARTGQTLAETTVDTSIIEKDIAEARIHTQKTLMKATENLLKRPRRPLRRAEQIRFLFIILANPQLGYRASESISRKNHLALSTTPDDHRSVPNFSRRYGSSEQKSAAAPRRLHTGSICHHSGILKRVLGILGNLPNDCHHYVVGWMARFSKSHFETLVGLVGRFVTYRLSRQHGRQRSDSGQVISGLVPNIPGGIESSPVHLHAVLHESRPSNHEKEESSRRRLVYNTDDWQLRAAARVMALLFSANSHTLSSAHKREAILPQDHSPSTAPVISQQKRAGGSMIVPLNTFYNTLLDFSDLVSDFEAWESRTARFSFCQYPFFLSIAAKSRILAHDARRQMNIKAREAFLDSILNHKDVSQYLNLKVRRDCLVEDSLRGVSEVVGAGSEDIKKSLRIEFIGEEGIDAGGLRKEWFLLLVREVFDPNHGLFVYDDDSQFCYFNPYCFESSEQFYLVGVLLGLAIYNSTILDIALPPFAFKKLMAAAPSTSIPATGQRQSHISSLDDLAEYRPALAKGLRALLDFDGDVQETFCHDFVAEVDKYGQRVKVPLCPNGDKKPVTNANRHEFVNLYVQYLLDTAIQRQFEPFKRGFFTVCGGNALALFRPEEIELMVRGSDEPLDVPTLRAVATYENWPKPAAITGSSARNGVTVNGNGNGNEAATKPNHSTDIEPSEPIVTWFWDSLARSTPTNQRKLLSFVTGSDRIPATGAASLSIRIAYLGDDPARYPIAHTCFNKLGLYQYESRQKLERMLWDAVWNSEGFGLK